MVFPVFYFGPISYFSKLTQSTDYQFEIHENFRKQTFRNRCYIQGANGKLRLSIPIEHDGSRQMKDIKISSKSNWAKEHLKSLVSAYKSSPFFEFYEDELSAVYQHSDKFLIDFNFKSIEFIAQKLKLHIPINTTTAYSDETNSRDFRDFFHAKTKVNPEHFPIYTQVFSEKFDFMPDLSILDLLFNQGPNATVYLKTIGAK